MTHPRLVTRRDALRLGAGMAAATYAASVGIGAEPAAPSKRTRQLNAYYFRAHTYTLVPRQVREDMEWMASAGTNIVSIAVLEQDLFAAVENIRILSDEARRVGMKTYVVPSRWGGLVAGAPKVPSIFSCQNPKGWILKKDGSPYLSSVSGVISSVFYPETFAFFCDSIDRVFRTWDIDGMILDEPKAFLPDYSEKAVVALGPNPSENDFDAAAVRFYERVFQYTKSKHPDKTTCMFLHANKSDFLVNACAKIQGLDVYGCDGRPWGLSDDGEPEDPGKVLLGATAGERFLSAAHKNGKRSLWLVENHNMRKHDYELMGRRFPQILAQPVDQLIYYYYPRNLEDPNAAMNIVRQNVVKFR